MKHMAVTLILSCTMGLSAVAQTVHKTTALTARQVLDQTATAIKSAGGIEANFEGTQFDGIKENGTSKGRICLKANQFQIDGGGAKTWFDGHTQWTLLDGSDEVNVSHPTAAELQHMNPYSFLDLYKKGYTLKLDDVNYQQKSCYEVRLAAQQKGQPIQLLIAVIDKQSHFPLSIRVKDNMGKWMRIRVNGIKTHRRFVDNTFKFNQKDYPGIEVIDLR